MTRMILQELDMMTHFYTKIISSANLTYLEEQIFLTLYMIFKTSQNQYQSLVRLETHIFAQCENMQSQIAAQIKN